MLNSGRFFALGVLSLSAIGCSASSSLVDSGGSNASDTNSADRFTTSPTDSASDARLNADTAVTAGCQPSASGLCSASTKAFNCSGGVFPQVSDLCPYYLHDTTSGEKVACCTLKPNSNSCTVDPAVSCPTSSSGYTCTGSDTPAQTSLIVCDAGTIDGDKTRFCCRKYQSTSCRLNPEASGCSRQYSFSCTGTDAPSAADSGLKCSKGTLMVDDTIGYCCAS